MNPASDMRIPLVFTGGTGSDAYLIEGGGAAPPGAYVARFSLAGPRARHPAGCACCRPRGAAANALAAMFHARATGAAPWFTRIVVSASDAGEDAVREAMHDVLVSARYRI